MSLTVSNIKKGDVFYTASDNDINKYEYLCLYPLKKLKYHIVINRTYQKPERIDEKLLEILLSKNLKTYKQAIAAQIEILERNVEILKQLSSLENPD